MQANFRTKSFATAATAVLLLTSLATAKVEREYSKVEDQTILSIDVPFISKNDGFLGVRDFESNISYSMALWVDGNALKGAIPKEDIPDQLAFRVSRDIEQTKGYREDAHLPRWEEANTIVILYRPLGQSKDEKPKKLEIEGKQQYSLHKWGRGSFSTESVTGRMSADTACELANSTDVTIAVQSDRFTFGEYDVKPKHMKGMKEICEILRPSIK